MGADLGGRSGARRAIAVAVGIGITAATQFLSGLVPHAAAQPRERQRAEKPAGGEPRGERLALPFSCRVEAGRVRLTPSRDRFYAVTGQRQSQSVTACSDADQPVCRTLVAHRFSFSCGGKKVAWSDVAATIGGRRTSQVWQQDRRINILIREGEVRPPQQASCGEAPSAPGAVPEPAPVEKPALVPITYRPCEPDAEAPAAPARVLRTHFALPEGFAPLALFGARIVDAAGAQINVERSGPGAASVRAGLPTDLAPRAPSAAGASPEPTQPSAMAGSGERTAATTDDTAAANAPPRRRMSRLLERMILSEPLPDIVPEQRLDIATAPPALAWTASVHRVGETGSLPESAVAATAASSRGLGDGFGLWLMLTIAIASGGWLAWSQHAVALGRLQRGLESTSFLKPLAGAVARLRTSASSIARSGSATYATDVVESRFRLVTASVERVGENSALRDVLDDELRRVRGRLAAASEPDDGAGGGRRIGAAAYRVLLRDLDRIERIAESAATGGTGGGTGGGSGAGDERHALAAGRMPASPREAYAILGVNGSVSDATLKKVADGLRMSWHPDLAHDDRDRANREERTKQINVAVELIVAERRALAPA